ncbi:MAG: monoamine oxidase [Thermoleophilaceae bacterium]|jgi:monoamine oxidase|nr:monoamine oxidase [Thermoleophilaceae bacterium]
MHVAVVGGGLAGLSAAVELVDRGCEVTVLEARDRVGGRTVTELHAGVLVDGGGQYVGPGQANTLAWAQRYGLEVCPAYAEGDWLLELDGSVIRQQGLWPALDGAALAELQSAVGVLDEMAATVPVDAPWNAPSALDWDRLTARDWVHGAVSDAAAREFLRLSMEITLAADWHEASLLHMLFMFHSLGGSFEAAIWHAQELRIVGGTQALAKAAAAQLGDRVRLESAVRAIRDRGDSVEIELADASTVSADRAVVALPPPLATRLTYDPALPGRRDHLCQRMPMGAALKAVAFYDEPFWRDEGLNGLVISAAGPVSWLYDNCWPDASAAMLVGFVTGRAAVELAGRPEAERREAIVSGIARTLGDRAARPLDYVDWRWTEEPWSRGCYSSYATPGAWTSTGPALRAPIGRVHWAGSDTAGEWVGFMDGAISSGRRVAEEIAPDA